MNSRYIIVVSATMHARNKGILDAITSSKRHANGNEFNCSVRTVCYSAYII